LGYVTKFGLANFALMASVGHPVWCSRLSRTCVGLRRKLAMGKGTVKAVISVERSSPPRGRWERIRLPPANARRDDGPRSSTPPFHQHLIHAMRSILHHSLESYMYPELQKTGRPNQISDMRIQQRSMVHGNLSASARGHTPSSQQP
jgi:hypothetical protein